MRANEASATPRWRLLSALVPGEVEDEVASVLGGGSLGVEIRPAGAGKSEVRVYLGPADDPSAWRARAVRVLEGHGLTAEAAGVSIVPVADERWVERWQASLRPLPLGERFVVVAGAEDEPAGGREVVRLVPGMAFGTGEHETTRMCAVALERLVAPGSRWLDLGTGTGILAIVAARCGAARVLAIDLDPEAAHVADASGNGNTGTITIGATGTQASAGTCNTAGHNRKNGLASEEDRVEGGSD
jgi:ribosomal protein L11 methyltransferase